ncbi:MAG: alpha-ketoacid dehydrogenase subunit beta [Actinomycetes bacterium]
MTETLAPSRTVTYRESLREALFEEMEADPRVILMGEDVGRYGGAYAVSKGLLEHFGDRRVIDTPMSEAAIVGAALGAAAVGARPVAEIMYMDFITLVMDQLVNQAAKLHFMFGGQLSAPMVVRVQQGIGRGAGPQHSQSLEAWFAHVPGLKVVAPSTPADAKGLLKAAIRDDDPVLFIEHKQLYARKSEGVGPDHVVPIGSADVKRAGTDVTVVAWSSMVHTALAAAERLAEEGTSAEVVDLRTIAPLDMATVLASCRRTGRLLVLHEACRTGGLGAEIAAQVAEELYRELRAPVRRLATPDVVLPANTTLERALVPDVDAAVTVVRELVRS